MSQEFHTETLESKEVQESSIVSSQPTTQEVPKENRESIKNQIAYLKDEIESIQEAQRQLASARSYGIPEDNIADQNIVELAHKSLPEKEALLSELKMKEKKTGKNFRGILNSLFSI